MWSSTGMNRLSDPAYWDRAVLSVHNPDRVRVDDVSVPVDELAALLRTTAVDLAIRAESPVSRAPLPVVAVGLPNDYPEAGYR